MRSEPNSFYDETESEKIESRIQAPYPVNRPMSGESSRISTSRSRPLSGSVGTPSKRKTSAKLRSNVSATGSGNIQDEVEVASNPNSEVSQPASFYGKSPRTSIALKKHKSKVQVSCEEEMQESSEYLESLVIPSVLVAIYKLLRLAKDGKEPDNPLKFLAMCLKPNIMNSMCSLNFKSMHIMNEEEEEDQEEEKGAEHIRASFLNSLDEVL